ncbi:MAG: hypothetical protein IPK82_12310 [Polyangiaceae bacterium]|nr:hypothetical protein [Polyangiaceae bacterium]
MRSLARMAVFCVAATLGCTTQPHSDSNTPNVAIAAGSLLRVAFDDISAETKPAVPISLTASDGRGLALVALTAHAVVDDPLAFTELHLTFENTEDRVREGTFNIVLPQGASISRFAMMNPDGLQEGEVVEKKRAREAYEDFLHRRQDPALLEQNAGNEFSARVFPIPGKSKKELIVSYSQAITNAAPYALPLKGLPEIATLHVEAYLAGRAAPVQTLHKTSVTPAADFLLESGLFPTQGGLRNGNLVAMRIKPVIASQPEPLTDALVLIDTSASRALGMVDAQRTAKRIAALIAKNVPDRGQLVVGTFDQSVDTVFEGPANQFGEDVIVRMRQRLALGASNLSAALSWAGEKAAEKRLSRVILITDGIPTAGNTSGEHLRGEVLRLKNAGVVRLDAIAMGGIRDDDLLRSLATAGLPRGGSVIDGASSGEEISRRLSEATRSNVEVRVEGADFVFPNKLDGVQAGDERLVFANVPENTPVRVTVGNQAPQSPTLAKAERPLLERAWVGAKIASLVERERQQGSSAELSKEIVGLSTKYRVLSPKTSLLVLENNWQYSRFGIDRTALADILITDGGRVILKTRATPAPPKQPPSPPPPPTAKPAPKNKPPQVRMGGVATSGGSSGRAASTAVGNDPMSARGNMWGDEIGDSFGAGGLGLTGIGEGGSGRGEGIGLGSIGTIGHGAGTSSGAAVGAGPEPASTAPRIESGRQTPGQPQTERRRVAAEELELAPASPTVASNDRARADSNVRPEYIEKTEPYTGQFKTVMQMIEEKRLNDAVKTAFEWRKQSPGDVLALVALGEGFEAAGELAQAARAYGSLIDLFPSRADTRRFAGERLERIANAMAQDMALDTYEKAVEERPDHPSSHRLYAYALLKKGRHEKAFEAILNGFTHNYPAGRFDGVRRILAEDMGIIAAAWMKADPKRKAEIEQRVRDEGGLIEDQPSIRFVLNWETDANDVDFHIYDRDGGHAFYGARELGSGGVLYADVTNGYGPECFTIRNKPNERKGPYILLANYYSRGPMGYGMGKVQIIDHDGKGGLKFEERPFVVMVDRGFVDLGTAE